MKQIKKNLGGRGGCDENTQYIIKIKNTPIIAFMGDYQEIFVWLSVSWRPLLLKSQVRERAQKHMNTDPFWEKFSNSPVSPRLFYKL